MMDLQGFLKQGVVLLTLFWLLQGCFSIPYDPGNPMEDARLTQRLKKKVETLYPKRFITIHRCVLEMGGRNYILNGYVSVNRPENSFNLVAQGEMGGTFFKLSKTGGQPVRVLKQNPVFEKNWIEDAAARDAGYLYLTLPTDGAELVRHGSGSVGLISKKDDSTTEEFRFELNHGSPDDIRLESFIVARGGACVYRVDFFYDQTVPGGDSHMAGSMLINDYKLKYKMRVTALKIKNQNEVDPKAGD